MKIYCKCYLNCIHKRHSISLTMGTPIYVLVHISSDTQIVESVETYYVNTNIWLCTVFDAVRGM